MGLNFLPATSLGVQKMAEYLRCNYHVNAPHGTTLADVIRPNFWSFHVALLKVNDIVDIVAEDGTFDIQLRVISKDVGKVNMRVLRSWEPAAAEAAALVAKTASEQAAKEEPDVPGFVINFAPKTRWRVIRDADRVEMVRDLASRAAALDWARAHASEAVLSAA